MMEQASNKMRKATTTRTLRGLARHIHRSFSAFGMLFSRHPFSLSALFTSHSWPPSESGSGVIPPSLAPTSPATRPLQSSGCRALFVTSTAYLFVADVFPSSHSWRQPCTRLPLFYLTTYPIQQVSEATHPVLDAVPTCPEWFETRSTRCTKRTADPTTVSEQRYPKTARLPTR